MQLILHFLFVLFCLRQSITMLHRLALNLLCSPGWPQTHGLPASASCTGLQASTITAGTKYTFLWLMPIILATQEAEIRRIMF
jgi:hypothetical protein